MNRTVLALSLAASLAAGAAAADPPAVSSAAGAQAQTAVAPPAPKKHGSDADTVICKRETVTGTRIGGQEICLTAAQWDQARQEDLDALRRAPETQPMGGAMMNGGMGH